MTLTLLILSACESNLIKLSGYGDSGSEPIDQPAGANTVDTGDSAIDTGDSAEVITDTGAETDTYETGETGSWDTAEVVETGTIDTAVTETGTIDTGMSFDPAEHDNDGDGLSENDGDCDDDRDDVSPLLTEDCDGRDNDCDGEIDEGTACPDPDTASFDTGAELDSDTAVDADTADTAVAADDSDTGVLADTAHIDTGADTAVVTTFDTAGDTGTEVVMTDTSDTGEAASNCEAVESRLLCWVPEVDAEDGELWIYGYGWSSTPIDEQAGAFTELCGLVDVEDGDALYVNGQFESDYVPPDYGGVWWIFADWYGTATLLGHFELDGMEIPSSDIDFIPASGGYDGLINLNICDLEEAAAEVATDTGDTGALPADSDTATAADTADTGGAADSATFTDTGDSAEVITDTADSGEEDTGTVADTGSGLSCTTDADSDGAIDEACGGDDCDDTDDGVYPGQREFCNGFDDDCDGIEDDGC